MTHWIAPGLDTDGQRMSNIANIVADNTGIDTLEMKSKSRERPITEARQLAIYFIEKNTKLTLNVIGRYFNRDHSTVIYARETVNDLYKTNPEFRHKFDMIKILVNGY